VEHTLTVELRASFEELFRYDEHGVPRIWKLEEDLDRVPKVEMALGLRQVREVVGGRTRSERSMFCGTVTYEETRVVIISCN
jgi:Root hair defective 3 GTP-binding protein (RHD3)